MSDNPSFVLRGVEDVVYEQRPIPESTLQYNLSDEQLLQNFTAKQFLTTKSLSQ
jgi:hypothetical protein